MRIALVVPYYDPRPAGDAALALWRFPTVPELAGALAARGHAVAGFHLSRTAARAEWSGVPHTFVPTGPLRRAMSRALWGRVRRFKAPYFEPGFELAARVRRWRPDVVHVFGANIDINLALLARMAAAGAVPLIVHFHGGLPADDPLTCRLQRSSLRRAARVLFTHADQAAPWRAAGFVSEAQIAVVTETSTRLRADRHDANGPPSEPSARQRLAGRPACVAVGRLHPLKDPPTLLAAFARVVDAMPSARLHLYFGLDAYHGRLHVLVQAVSGLAERIVFHGYTKSAGVAAALSGADIFVQTSRREWSSLSVMEALSVGCPAVLSDIPAFRTLSNEGRVARLAPMGDAAAFANAILALARDAEARHALADAGRAWFDERLSFEALARDVESVYRSCAAVHADPDADAGDDPRGYGTPLIGRTTTRRVPASTDPPSIRPPTSARSRDAAS